jgi:hypothetical protein
MNQKLRKLYYRVSKIVETHGLESQEVFAFAADHPVTMKLLLNRLKKDNEKALENSPKSEVKPLLGPGDPDI